jgi:hypothetical protein
MFYQGAAVRATGARCVKKYGITNAGGGNNGIHKSGLSLFVHVMFQLYTTMWRFKYKNNLLWQNSKTENS